MFDLTNSNTPGRLILKKFLQKILIWKLSEVDGIPNHFPEFRIGMSC
jgi:hypothetical protein